MQLTIPTLNLAGYKDRALREKKVIEALNQANAEIVLIWCDFTPKSEPISRISANSEPRHLSAERRTRPTSRPLCLFLGFPPAEFLF